jgi:hypothetical protein
MELDDLKGAWAQYDKKLSENLKFNEVLFKKLNLDKSRREMSTPYNYEIASSFLSVIALLFIASWTIQYGKDLVYLISGSLSVLSFITMFVFSLVKVRLLSRMDYYNSPVLELQKALCRFKDKYFRLKRAEIILFPFYIVILLPICAKGLRHIDFLTQPAGFIIAAVAAIGIGLPAALWIYKHLYEKKIKNTSDFLNELTRFEEEK